MEVKVVATWHSSVMAAHDKNMAGFFATHAPNTPQTLQCHCQTRACKLQYSQGVEPSGVMQKSGKHFKAAAAMANDVQPGAMDTLEAGHLQFVWNDLR